MATIRTRSYFTTKFITGYKPSQTDYGDLFLSTTMKKETADRAKLYTGSADLSSEQGLVVRATDAQVKANTAQLSDRTLVAQPHQIPTVVAIANSTSEDMPTTVLESIADVAVTTRNKYDIRPTASWVTWLLSRLFKSGGTAGQVPVKVDGTDYNWGWGTLTISQTSGTVPIDRGGTGQTTANLAMNALLPSKTGNSLKVLRVNTGETDYELVAPSSLGDLYKSTSVSSIAIGAGSKIFAVGTGYSYAVGNRIRATDSGNTANYVEGTVTSYSAGNLTINVNTIGGSGTISSWNINLGSLGTKDYVSTLWTGTQAMTNTYATVGTLTYTTPNDGISRYYQIFAEIDSRVELNVTNPAWDVRIYNSTDATELRPRSFVWDDPTGTIDSFIVNPQNLIIYSGLIGPAKAIVVQVRYTTNTTTMDVKGGSLSMTEIYTV
jgi:hypothetical protein